MGRSPKRTSWFKNPDCPDIIQKLHLQKPSEDCENQYPYPAEADVRASDCNCHKLHRVVCIIKSIPKKIHQ